MIAVLSRSRFYISVFLVGALWLDVGSAAKAQVPVSGFPHGPITPARTAQLETIRADRAYCEAEADQLEKVSNMEFAQLHGSPQQVQAIVGDDHMSDQALKATIAEHDEVFKNFEQPMLIEIRASCAKKSSKPDIAALKAVGPLLGIKPGEMNRQEYQWFVLKEVDFRNGRLKPQAP